MTVVELSLEGHQEEPVGMGGLETLIWACTFEMPVFCPVLEAGTQLRA